ncbi:predicted protein [Histoplasma capsulatum G186AR]|uniref:Uncharacterized protein n=1 Tax=Ajellomyces capsulatus (strain G186AR / H82 / ATCC MYA-2454 / RMSCC 2432) TaxID=447093 RepID=C0NWP1_AJECG|nr:uncharacterized protein HCBG_07571 [Histoplasma capsulatum G186AR]EEH04346.1 predicted protein [Histoplasma capsulatum G186AR]
MDKLESKSGRRRSRTTREREADGKQVKVKQQTLLMTGSPFPQRSGYSGMYLPLSAVTWTCVHLVPLLPLISQRGLARSQALCILLRTLVEMAGQSQPRTIALTGFDAAATDARMLQSPTERCLKTQGSTDAESPSHTPY